MAKYDFDGDKYEKASEHQTEWGLNLLEELELTGKEEVLDLGCGDGKLTARIAELVPEGKVLGIDYSEGMLETAQKRQKANLGFEFKDIKKIDYREQFDVIFSNAALHWVKEHGKLLENCYCALKEGGIIRFNFAGEGNCSHLYSVVREVMAEEEFKEDFTDFVWPWYMPSIKEYERVVKKRGFSRVKVWGENRDRYFEDREQMVDWIEQPCIVPFQEHLPQKKRKLFRDRVVTEMIARCEQEDGRCFETFRRINVMAEKFSKTD